MSIKERISSQDRIFEEKLNGKDAAGLAGLYTKEGAVLPPGAPRFDGTEGVRGFWQAAIDMGLTDIALDPLEVEEVGDTAIEIGRVTGALKPANGGATQLAGKYLVIWKRGPDQTWRLHRDIWNFDA